MQTFLTVWKDVFVVETYLFKPKHANFWEDNTPNWAINDKGLNPKFYFDLNKAFSG